MNLAFTSSFKNTSSNKKRAPYLKKRAFLCYQLNASANSYIHYEPTHSGKNSYNLLRRGILFKQFH